jgi:hypothetical protein
MDIILSIVLVGSIVLGFVRRSPFWSGNIILDLIIDGILVVIISFVHDEKKSNKLYKKEREREEKAKALYDEAVKYDSGDGVKRDRAKARELLEQAAALDSKEAQCMLGVYYQYGYGGLTKDPAKAVELYRSGKEHLRLGKCYLDGIGTEKNAAAAVSEFRSCHYSGEGSYLLGKCEENGNGTKQNLKYAFWNYESASHYGYLPANMALARCYEKGIGTEVDLDKALKLYTTTKIRVPKLAAQCEKAIADVRAELVRQHFQTVAASLPENEDVKTLLQQASSLYESCAYDKFAAQAEKAAVLGDNQAQYLAGYLYEKGIGVKANEDIAFAWYQRALAQNQVMDALPGYQLVSKRDPEMGEKMLQLGYQNQCAGAFYYMGERVTQGYQDNEPDPEQGFALYMQGATRGHVPSMVRVAECYHNGKGVDCDEAEAEKWYQAAKETGKPDGCYAYGLWRLETRGLSGTQEERWDTLEPIYEAAQENHPEACYAWGCILEKTKVDTYPDFWKVSAENGYVPAMSSLLARAMGQKNEKEILHWDEAIAETGNEKAIRYAAITTWNMNDLERSSYWWEKLMALGDPEAGDMLNRLDTLMAIQKEIEKNERALEYDTQALKEAAARETARMKELNADYDLRVREDRLSTAGLINMLSGPADAADYLAKHFRNEINRDPILSYLVPLNFPHTLNYLL